MANRDYWASFGASAVSGLSPTFIVFVDPGGNTGSKPSITEPGSKGIYKFSFDSSLTQIAFVLDGATSGLAFQDRYVKGILDIYDSFGMSMNAIGVSLSALGVSQLALGNTLVGFGVSNLAIGTSLVARGVTLSGLIGDTSSTFGTNSVDPSTMFGFLKRVQETREGNETYTKSSGALSIYSRGSSQLLAAKTIADSSSSTTKT